MEDLSVKNMVRNHHLARAISDAAWRQLRAMLAYKCQWYGRDLVVRQPGERRALVAAGTPALLDRLVAARLERKLG